MNTLQILIEARKLIEKPENWGQGFEYSRPASTFCIGQAITRVDQNSYRKVSDFLVEGLGYWTVVAFNDEPGRTHQEVLELMDRAIARASTEVQS